MTHKGADRRTVYGNNGKAEFEYTAFNKVQRITSDFDREAKRLLDNETEGS